MGAKVTAVCGSRNNDFVKSLGADIIINYDTSHDIIRELQNSVGTRGPYDIVFDTVSSHDARDQAYQYEQRIRFSPTPFSLLSINSKYVVLGGMWQDWVKAHVRRFTGINLFGKGRELFWVRFPESTSYLRLLTQYIEEGKLKVVIAGKKPLTNEGMPQ